MSDQEQKALELFDEVYAVYSERGIHAVLRVLVVELVKMLTSAPQKEDENAGAPE